MSERLGLMLQHPLRRRLLLEFTAGPGRAPDLARRLGAPLNSVAYHTAMLLREGYIEAAGVERRRGGADTPVLRHRLPEIEAEDWQGGGGGCRWACAAR